VHVHPTPCPNRLLDIWEAAVRDAGLAISDVALVWRLGQPRPTGQEAASWRPNSIIDPEFDDDDEFAELLDWANSATIRPLRRVLVWTGRTPEGVAGLLRHELEHTIQLAAHPELDRLHRRAREELMIRGATGKSYNAVPMEVDANRAAARFLRGRYGADRLQQLVAYGDKDAACFRPTMDPEPLDTLVERMRAFILDVKRRDLVAKLEAGAWLE
jgi:hypothetical protein